MVVTSTVISTAVAVIFIILLFAYIIWLRYQLRNVILTNNGLYSKLEEVSIDRDRLLAALDNKIIKNKEVENMISSADNLSNAQKVYMISRLK
ncbi:hypothetical protein DS691_21455 [Salmonella enterica subsp. enterica serovar Bareilly]|nr:hypothetical protein [Salmonella enterica subsp. enterica serovar Bareilly]